jgi:hypothetical protein
MLTSANVLKLHVLAYLKHQFQNKNVSLKLALLSTLSVVQRKVAGDSSHCSNGFAFSVYAKNRLLAT